MTAHNPHPAKTHSLAKTEPRRLSQLFGFRTRLYLTWAVLFALCVMFFMSFDLKLSIILDKLPNLMGLHLGPNGFLQGAAPLDPADRRGPAARRRGRLRRGPAHLGLERGRRHRAGRQGQGQAGRWPGELLLARGGHGRRACAQEHHYR